jgi:ribosomal RNA-processing protein 36
MKKHSTALAFDEASSGSDGSSSDEESVSSVPDKDSKPSARGNSERPSPKRDDASNSSDSDESDSDSESDGEQVAEEPNGDEESDDGASESDSEAEEEEDLPLHERIRKKEERGLSLQKVRQRKSRALEVASERLAKLKGAKPDENDDTQPPSKKKKSKHAPTEVSSKRADYFARGAPKLNESGIGVEIGAHKYKPLDPRTSNLSGHLNDEQFEKNYAFLDEIRGKEMSQLKKQIAARKVTGKKGKKMRRRLDVTGGTLEEDQENLKRLQQEKAELSRRQLDRAAKQTVKRKIRDEVEQGKGAYFLKRKDQRRLHLEAKLEEIRKRGGDKAVDKAVAKRRKKNKSRDAGLFAK